MISVSLRPMSEIEKIVGKRKKRNRTFMYFKNKKWFSESNFAETLTISSGKITSSKISSNGKITINVKM